METLDFYVSLLMPFMEVIPEEIQNRPAARTRRTTAPTPEQWAKRAERLALIGLAGEEFVLDREKQRLVESGLLRPGYPFHTALSAPNAGYDILSLSPNAQDIFIEVKTTTMPREHPWGRVFFLSAPEYQFYRENGARYKLYRVWNIYVNPVCEEIDLDNVSMQNDGFRVTLNP
jgi:hypothetical protein